MVYTWFFCVENKWDGYFVIPCLPKGRDIRSSTFVSVDIYIQLKYYYLTRIL